MVAKNKVLHYLPVRGSSIYIDVNHSDPRRVPYSRKLTQIYRNSKFKRKALVIKLVLILIPTQPNKRIRLQLRTKYKSSLCNY